MNKNKAYIYPNDLYEKLEFDKVLEKIEGYCNSSLGVALVRKVKMSANVEWIQNCLNQIQEFRNLIEAGEPFPSQNYLDLKEEIKRLQLDGAVLSLEEIFRILSFLITIQKVYFFFEKRFETYPVLFEIIRPFTFNKQLINVIKDVIDDDGKIRNNATPELMRIRKQINLKFQEIDRKFRQVMSDYNKSGFLTPEKESIKGGRRVLSVLAEHKRKVKGLILDESSTGRTVFIEPESVLQAGNDLMEWYHEEKREIAKILKTLTITIRPHIDYISQFQKIISIYDFISAKAYYANHIDATSPIINKEKSFSIINGIHPVLLEIQRARNKTVVPLNLNMDEESRILVISGPNAGGKSVSLKTVGLLQLMMQCGLHIPADEGTSLTVFRQLFVDIGDEQSLENDLSTYSSRLTNMKHFVRFGDAKTLILMDEVGAGTDPVFGGAIAEAVLNHIYKKRSFAAMTTHFSNLKAWASERDDVLNGAMLFDYATLSPKYVMETGKPGSSYAFELAQKIGFQKEIVEEAKTLMDQGVRDFDELINELQVQKQQVQEEESSLQKKQKKYEQQFEEYTKKKEKLVAHRDKLKQEYQEKATTALENLNKKFENIIKAWKEDQNNKALIKRFKEEMELEKATLKKAQEHLKTQKHARVNNGTIIEGSMVKFLDGKGVGRVLELRKNNAIVEFGNLKTKVKLNEIVLVNEETKKSPEQNFTQKLNMITGKSQFESTIDIRGMRMEEALPEVERFIDQALMYNFDQVKILHGKGTGVLKKSIRRLLKQTKAVSTYKDELPEFGGDGITIVEFS